MTLPSVSKSLVPMPPGATLVSLTHAPAAAEVGGGTRESGGVDPLSLPAGGRFGPADGITVPLARCIEMGGGVCSPGNSPGVCALAGQDPSSIAMNTKDAQCGTREAIVNMSVDVPYDR